MAVRQCVVLVTMGLLVLRSVAEKDGARHRRGSIPGAVLVMRGLPATGSFLMPGLEGNPDLACPSHEPDFECPEGWTAFVDDQGPTCLHLMEEPLSRAKASNSCQAKGGNLVSILTKERQKNVERFLQGVTEPVWTGLFRKGYSTLSLWPNNVPAQYRKEELYQTFYSRSECVYLSSPSRNWTHTDACHTPFSSVCDLATDCKAGAFGQYCEKRCHCHGSSCKGQQPCQYGCSLGWMGPHCCAKKEPAKIAHYCMHPAKERRHLLLRVDPKDVSYDIITPIDVNGKPLKWCHDVTMSREGDGRYTIKVPVIGDDDGDVDSNYETENRDSNTVLLKDDCVAEKTGENAYRWRVLLQEKKGLLLPLDRTLVFTCDFKEAETLSRGLHYSIRNDEQGVAEKLRPEEVKPAETKEDVILQAVDPYSGDVIRQATLGSSVALRMRLNVAQEVTAQAVSPYDCRAASPDFNNTERLPDFSWCPSNSSAAIKDNDSNTTIVSKPFQLFTFPGYRSVVISCNFRLCFGLQQRPLCGHPCHGVSLRRKRSSDRKVKSVTTTIHILPEPHAHNMDGNIHQSAAAEMMTPVTWFLVVVLMLITSLLIYILFRRSKRQPVRLLR